MRSAPQVLSLRRTVRGTIPQIPLEAMAREILGANYELSLVICADTLAQRINKTYRKKEYSPNVLSFPLSKREGEIFLNVRKAEREARTYKMTSRARFAHLFVHGCFHLKGLDHSDKMDAAEKRVLRQFNIE